MQKQKKQMILVLVLLVLFCGAYAGMRMYNEKQEKKETAQAEADKIYITKVEQEDITAFSYQNAEGTIQFVKEDDTWISENDETIKLDQSAVTSILGKLSTLEAEEAVETSEDFSVYGFDTPLNVITFTTAEGTTTLTIGMQNSITNQYYLRKNEENTLYLVSSSFPSGFSQTLADLEDTTEDTEAVEEVITETETAEEAVTE